MCVQRWWWDGVQCEHVGPLVLARKAALDEVLGLLRHLQKHVTHFTHDCRRTVANEKGRADKCGYRQNMDMGERPLDSQETSSQRLRRAALCPPAANSPSVTFEACCNQHRALTCSIFSWLMPSPKGFIPERAGVTRHTEQYTACCAPNSIW
jgi:hypothetical protein